MPRRGAQLAIALLASAWVAAAAPPAHAELQAGAARVDITPENGGTTLGFVRPDIAVRGVHTRLTGRVLVLSDGDTEVALLSTDLGFPLEKDSLVARVADLGFSHETVLYTGTHTHSGPGELAGWQVEQLAQAIRRAHAALRPAVAGWGQARVTDVNRNRSIEAHLANHGQDLFYGEGHPDDDPEGEDHTRDTLLRVLRVETPAGDPIAAWTHFPVHLTTSTPAVDVWDADLAGTAEHHLSQQVGGDAVALYTNGNEGDLMPRFDSYNVPALMDLHGRRIARGALQAWRKAGRTLQGEVPVDVRWTRACHCGQEVEPGRRIASEPLWGLAFFGGSEDGASIFHEPLATEGRRLPEALADPVQGRKIPIAPSLVAERVPEVHVIRIGDRLLLGTPGEPSVEMGRRLQAAVAPHLPTGVRDPVVVGLANDYIGYLTTPEEYEMQHYEGGHTVFGTWTSLLTRNALVDLTRALAAGGPAPPPAVPAALGSAGDGDPAVGNGGIRGELVSGPTGAVKRMTTITLEWRGAPEGVDRPLDTPFLVLERRSTAGDWEPADSDLGIGFVWRESEGHYRARYDVDPALTPGTHRLRVLSGAYQLTSEPFEIVASDELRVRGVTARRARRGRTRLVVLAQNPPPDPAVAIRWRATTPAGGRVRLALGGRRVLARWSNRAGGWIASVRGRVPRGAPVTIPAGGLVDAHGNRSGPAVELRVGELAGLVWPANMPVGGGRTPGPFGQGTFPP